MPFLPHLLQPLDKAVPKAIREEKGRAPIRTGGDKLKLAGTVNAVVEGHGAGEYTLDGARPEENVPSESQTPNIGCLRQPASRDEVQKWCTESREKCALKLRVESHRTVILTLGRRVLLRDLSASVVSPLLRDSRWLAGSATCFVGPWFIPQITGKQSRLEGSTCRAKEAAEEPWICDVAAALRRHLAR